MAIVASRSLWVEGFQGQITSYTVEARDPRVDRDAGTLSFDIYTGNREGSSAIIQNAVYTVSVNGQQVIEDERNFPARTGYMDKASTFIVDVDPTQTQVDVTVGVDVVGEPGDTSLSFTAEIEQPPEPVTDDDISSSCSLSTTDTIVGNPVTVFADVVNNGEQAAAVDVTVSAGGVSETSRVELDSGETTSVSVEFDLPVGEHQSSVSTSVV